MSLIGSYIWTPGPPVVGTVWGGVEVRRCGLAEGSLSLVSEL